MQNADADTTFLSIETLSINQENIFNITSAALTGQIIRIPVSSCYVEQQKH
jgi:hypothetical protein